MSLHDRGRGRSVPSLGEWAATGIGFVVALVGVMYVVAAPEPFEQWWIELAAAAAMPAVLMYGGYWLATNDFDPGEVYTVAQGWFVGVVALSVVAVWAVMSARTSEPVVVESLFHLVSVASAGAVLGLAFGLHTTRLTEQFPGVASASAADASGEETAAPMQDADEQSPSSPASTSSRQDAEARCASSPGSHARRDAAKQSSASPRSASPREDADATTSADDATDADAATDPTRIESLLDDRAVTDERRRSAVLALARRDDTFVDLTTLAAELESEWDARNRDTIDAELHHVHLPKLDEVGVIEYDAEATVAQLLDDEWTVTVR